MYIINTMNTLSIYISDVSALDSEEAYLKACENADSERRHKADKLRNLSDKKLCLCAGLLLDFALNEQGIPADGREISYTGNGKPYLKDNAVYFNLSHSGEKVMCIVCDSPCGCDVEKIGRNEKKIAERFFSESENTLLNGTENEEEYRDLFYRLWTLKESFIKCTGEGLGRALSSFLIEFDGEKPVISDCENRYSVGEIKTDDGYKYAFCVECENYNDVKYTGEISDGMLKIQKYGIS